MVTTASYMLLLSDPTPRIKAFCLWFIFYFLATLQGLQDLSSLTKDRTWDCDSESPKASSLGRQGIPNDLFLGRTSVIH